MKLVERLEQNWLLNTEISKLEARVWRVAQREKLKTIVVTSAVRGEGKSTTVAFLATALGLYPDRKILAVDFDFRIPFLNSYFEIGVPTGIDKVLAGEAPLHRALIKTPLASLDLALPTVGGADPNLLHRTNDLHKMIEGMRERYDLVLMDTPAMIPVADATAIIPESDGVIIAAMAGKTTSSQLKRVREICAGVDANLLGLIVGNLQEAAPEYIAQDYDYEGYYGERRKNGSAGAEKRSAKK